MTITRGHLFDGIGLATMCKGCFLQIGSCSTHEWEDTDSSRGTFGCLTIATCEDVQCAIDTTYSHVTTMCSIS